jgi:hypothetical protein
VYFKVLEMSSRNPRIMYLVLRRDLLTELKWPLGALITQAAHAATAVLWEYRTDEEVLKYMDDLDAMRKVTLQVLYNTRHPDRGVIY